MFFGCWTIKRGVLLATNCTALAIGYFQDWVLHQVHHDNNPPPSRSSTASGSGSGGGGGGGGGYALGGVDGVGGRL